jgi:RNA-directed DNA polymerase
LEKGLHCRYLASGLPDPKAQGKQRPLGIPVMVDRCHQARVHHALEPEWEARFEPRSYGFRPGRSCQDAIEILYNTLRGKKSKRVWIVDADLKAAFDKIDHVQLLSMLGSFPDRDMIAAWLKAGVIEQGKGFAPTEEGTPQGGIVSPLLMNVALHGLEEAAGVRYRTEPSVAGKTVPDAPVLVRYADDFVTCCHSRQQAEQVKVQLAGWLATRGLSFNEEKTNIVHLSQGFDFLGFNLRGYPNGKLLIKPSSKAVRRVRERLATEMRSLRGSNAMAVIVRLSPIVRGWAAYYRTVVSSRVFNTLDSYAWYLTYRWARRNHQGKSRKWVTARYFGRFNKFRSDRWVFGDRTTGAYLPKFSWTDIVRHTLVQRKASPDDPALAEYWARRRRRIKPPLDAYTLRLLTRQDARCPLCGDHLLTADQPPQSPQEWERWWLHVTRKAIVADYLLNIGRPSSPDGNHSRLVHASCYRGLQARLRSGTALQSRSPTRPA